MASAGGSWAWGTWALEQPPPGGPGPRLANSFADSATECAGCSTDCAEGVDWEKPEETGEEGPSPRPATPLIRVGPGFQAAVADFGSRKSGGFRDDSVLLWTPSEDEGPVAAYLRAAEEIVKASCPSKFSRLQGILEELALQALREHGGDFQRAVSSLPAVAEAHSRSMWDEQEEEELKAAVKLKGKDLKSVHATLQLAGGSRSYAEVVAHYFKVCFPCEPEEVAKQPRIRRPKQAQPGPSRAAAEYGEGGGLMTLEGMLMLQVVLPGKQVLSTLRGEQGILLADLLADGRIRCEPTGQRAMVYDTPAKFVRAARSASGASAPLPRDSWAHVKYKGLPLSLIRDALTSEEAAVKMVGQQERGLEEWQAAKLAVSAGTAAEPPRPLDRDGSARGPARKRARSEEEELKIRCQVCSSGEDGASMLLCDGCNGGAHLTCLDPPLPSVPMGDWFCATCRDGAGLSAEQHEAGLFEVDAILEKRTNSTTRRVDYLVRWKGYDSSFDSWEPRSNLVGAKEELLAFERLRKHAAADADAAAAASSRSDAPTARPSPANSPLAGPGQAPHLSTEARGGVPPPRLPLVPGAGGTLDLEDGSEEEPPALTEPEDCVCRAPCSLHPLLEGGLLQPGVGVLAVCCKGELTFGDLDPLGSITTVNGGHQVCHRFACSFVRAARRRAGLPPSTASTKGNIHASISYKGVKLDTIRPPPSRVSRR